MIAKFILGTKGNTSQVFSDGGDRMPVTFVKTRPCYVVNVRTMDTNGYWGVQLAFGEAKHVSKPTQGIVKKAGVKAPLRFLKEVRLAQAEVIEEGKKKGLKVDETTFFIGDEVSPAFFAKGDLVKVTGKSKGKGFQGVVKRHKFAGGPRTHGQSDRERAPGSIGQGTTPGRVYKGKRMAGRMGYDTVTIKNLLVVDVLEDGLLLKGLIPGVKNSLLSISSANAVVVPMVEEIVEEVVEQVPEEAPVVEEVPVEETPVVEVEKPVEEVVEEVSE